MTWKNGIVKCHKENMLLILTIHRDVYKLDTKKRRLLAIDDILKLL